MKVNLFEPGDLISSGFSDIKNERRHSLPSLRDNRFLKCINATENSAIKFKKYEAISDLRQVGKRTANAYLCKVEYKLLSIVSDVSAEKYVYLGMLDGVSKINLGMSVNDDGDLILVKGESFDLIRGLYEKHTSGYTYQSALLSENQCGIKLINLFVNKNGGLVGEDKHTGKLYLIDITPESSHKDIGGQYISVSFQDYTRGECDNLEFEIDVSKSISFTCDGEKLWGEIIQPAEKIADLSIRYAEVKLPLKKQYKIKSIKRAVNMLQIEATSENRLHIYYLNPRHICLRLFIARRISHKPPQSFSSRLGNDPHEKYHAGQPFSVDRKGNFSARSLPLLSFLANNSRCHIKKAIISNAEGRKVRAAIDIAKGLDIGIEGICTTTSGMVKNIIPRKPYRHSEGKKAVMEYHLDALQSRAKKLSGLINDVLEHRDELDLSDALIETIKKLNVKDRVHLTSSERIGGFFGIASGGLPFCPGWFAGILGELCYSHNLSLSRTEEDTVRVTFTNEVRRGGVGLAGTGQGLEKTLIGSHRLDYMTVLPVEANLIIAAHLTDKNDFSFSLAKNDFELFVKQTGREATDLRLRKHIINESELIRLKEKQLVIMLEGKSELRFEIGGMATPDTYLVLPRTALGARLALNVLKIKSTSRLIVGKNNNAIISHQDNAVLIQPEMDIFNETKIMPIPMRREELLWCLPLPLTEEYKVLKPFRMDKGITLWDKEAVITPTKSDSRLEADYQKEIKEYYSQIFSIHHVTRIPFFMTRANDLSMRKGLTLEQVAKYENNIHLMMGKISRIKESLSQQERMSLNKTCEVIIVSHYESVRHYSDDASGGYRLKNLEIRRLGTLSHETATLPLSIIRFSSKNEILYNEFLGDIFLLYRHDSDITPYTVESRLHFIY